MTIKNSQTYTVKIYMAGDIEQAKQVLRKDCLREGLCVTIHPRNYIYSGGEETGFVVELINYPRFDNYPDQIWNRAKLLAEQLREALFQHSYLLMDSKNTEWNSLRN